MKLTIEIDEKLLAELVTKDIAKQIASAYTSENRDSRLGIRDGVDKAVKDYVYSQKEEIISRVIDRASVEIVKKGMPKLIKKLSMEGN